jgi:hypothetical protein
MAKNDLTKYKPEIAPFAGGAILHKPVDEFSPGEAVVAFTVVQHIEKCAKNRLAELKPRILNDDTIKDHGEPTPGGGTKTNVRGSTITRVRTVKKFGDEDKLKELLEAKGLEASRVFDEVRVVTKKLVVNPSKLAQLVELGHFTKEEMEACHKTSWSLRVKAAKDITKLLEAVVDQGSAENRKTIFDGEDPF